MEHSYEELKACIEYQLGEAVLDLRRKRLSKVPDAVTELSELGVLLLNENNLTELPKSICKLKNLRSLNLDHNRVTHLPDDIGDLKELRELSVSNNQLVCLPSSILRLNWLSKLNVSGNRLSEFPAVNVGQLVNLRNLRVSGNPLNVDALRTILKLRWQGRRGMDLDIRAPTEIDARGERAQLAYRSALRDGAVNVYRGRILLIGQDRAGKTSLKKSLIGLPFNPKEKSTEGIEVDSSIFQVDVDKAENWQPIDESKLGLLGCSQDVAEMIVKELCVPSGLNWIQEEKEGEVKYGSDHTGDGHKNGEQNIADPAGEKEEDLLVNQVLDPKVDSVIELNSVELDHESMIDTASPPDEIKEQTMELMNYVHGVTGVGVKVESVVSVEVWDFAGQELYYASHPVFLTSRAIYILVCNLSKSLHDIAQPCVRQGNNNIKLDNPNSETNLENLLSWLSTVHSITQMRGETCDDAEEKLPHLRPPVIIVGTHADKPFEDIATMKSEIQRAIAGKDYEGHVVRPIFSIDNTARSLQRKIKKVFKQDKHIDHIQALQDRIMEVLRQEPYMGESIPVRWLNFEKVIDALQSKEVYHLDITELQTYAKDRCFINDEEEFTTMVNFYHDMGIIIQHCSTVILSAKWLIDLFRQLIAIPHFNKMDPKISKHWEKLRESGVLNMELVEHVFSKFLLKDFVRDDILDLMEQFGLIAKFSPPKTDEKYFVPSQLKVPPDSLCAMVPSRSDPCPLYVFFGTGFVPHGLFTRLVSRLVSWCSEAGPSQSPTLYRNGAWFVIGRRTVYDLVLFCKKQYIKFFVMQRSQDQHVSGDKESEVAIQVREFVGAALQSLSQDLLYLRGLQYQICVACPYCPLEKCTGHNQLACSHVDCRHLLEIRQGDPLICKKKPSNKVLTVEGLEKWFSQSTSQELHSPFSGKTQSHAQPSILKVTLLADEWGSSKGGLSTINRTLAIHLAKLPNVQVTIIVPQFECGEDDKRAAKGHNISIMEAHRRPGFSDPLDWLSFPPRNLDIQVVIGHGAKLGKQAQIIQESHCCKWVQVVHTEPEELAMYKNYPGAITKGEGKNRDEVELCQLADLVVAVGPKLTEAFSSYLSSSHQDVFQLMPGTFKEFSDVEHATTRASAKFKVLTFGRGDFEDFSLKGYDIAAQAIAEMKDSSYRLIFVGAPDGKQDEVAEILCQTGIPRNQLFVRSFLKDKQRLKELFCEVDVAIMPSRTEGFGLTALEAMSAGLPILVSGNSGFGEALRCLPMGESFVIDSDDPKEWAKAIAAIQQKSRAQRLEEIQRLRRSYEERFSWERQCKSLVDTMWKMVYDGVPDEINARGPRAKLAYENALKKGEVKLYRARIMLMGKDRAGKTSLKKSFLGLPFDPQEDSTDGIQVDPSKFEVKVDQVKNWKLTNENLGVSQFMSDLTKMVAREIQEDGDKEEDDRGGDEKVDDNDVKEQEEKEVKEDGKEKETPGDLWRVFSEGTAKVNNEVTKTGVPAELNIDSTLPPEEFEDHLVQRLKGLNLQSDASTVEHHMTLDLWDFAGQHLYYASYPVFLSPRAVYMLVYDLSKGLKDIAEPCFKQGTLKRHLSNQNKETNLENLLSWLVSVRTMCLPSKAEDLPYCRPPVFIVGTHADEPHEDIKEMELQIQQEIFGKDLGLHVIPDFFSVDNTQGSADEGVVALQKRMIKVLTQEPYMGERVPIRWFNFEKVVKALIAEEVYYLNLEQLQGYIQKFCFIEDEDEVTTMLDFYHDLGVIVRHRNTVVLRAQWLIEVFRQLITICPFREMEPRHSQFWKEMETTGALHMELVDHVFSKYYQQGLNKEDILNMMEQFGLIVKFVTPPTNEKYYVPCQLKTPPKFLCEMELSPSDPCPLYLNFIWGFVPHGLFFQLLSRCTRWYSENGYQENPDFFDGAARFFIGKYPCHQFILLCRKTFIKIILTQPQESASLLETNKAAIIVRTFLEEAVQTLKSEVPWLRNLMCDLCVACPGCLRDEEACSIHEQKCCTHVYCLCLLKVEGGIPKHCQKRREMPTLPGLKIWFSLEDVSEEEAQMSNRSKGKVSFYTPPLSKRIKDTALPVLRQIELESKEGTSKAELSVNFRKNITEKGFVVSNNRGEGNCMFFALSEQLGLIKGIEISHEQLRKTVVQYLLENPALTDGTELFHFVDGYSSWDAYLTSMMTDGTWGDHVILHGAANYFKTCIQVVSSHHLDVMICPEYDDTGSKRLVLGHVHELHYVSLIPCRGETARYQPEVTVTLLENKDLPKTSLPWNDGLLPIDMLLLTVEDCEFLSCLSYLNYSFCKSYCKELGYAYFGEMGESEITLRTAVMKCYRGSITAGGSTVSVLSAVRILRPKAVFLVGVCYSLKSCEVKLGDVVISEKLITCVPSSEEFGDKVPLKSLFLRLIPNAGDGWEPPLKDPKALEVKIHRGDFLSVPGVIDNNECCETIIKRFPQAVAMELEGQGLHAAAHDLDIPWIIIKGISDYKDGRKSGTDCWKKFASLMAASLAVHILSNPMVFRDWPHYTETREYYNKLPATRICHLF